jgi:hypothetical protein
MDQLRELAKYRFNERRFIEIAREAELSGAQLLELMILCPQINFIDAFEYLTENFSTEGIRDAFVRDTMIRYADWSNVEREDGYPDITVYDCAFFAIDEGVSNAVLNAWLTAGMENRNTLFFAAAGTSIIISDLMLGPTLVHQFLDNYVANNDSVTEADEDLFDTLVKFMGFADRAELLDDYGARTLNDVLQYASGGVKRKSMGTLTPALNELEKYRDLISELLEGKQITTTHAAQIHCLYGFDTARVWTPERLRAEVLKVQETLNSLCVNSDDYITYTEITTVPFPFVATLPLADGRSVCVNILDLPYYRELANPLTRETLGRDVIEKVNEQAERILGKLNACRV